MILTDLYNTIKKLWEKFLFINTLNMIQYGKIHVVRKIATLVKFSIFFTHCLWIVDRNSNHISQLNTFTTNKLLVQMKQEVLT